MRRGFTLIELIVVVIVLGIGALIVAYIAAQREEARRISCASNLKSLGLSCRMYSQEYNGHLPDRPGRQSFEMMRSGGYCENVRMYTCPSTSDMIWDGFGLATANVSYLYAAGLCESDSADSAIMRDRDNNHRKFGNIVFIDGHVGSFAGADWTTNSKNANFSY